MLTAPLKRNKLTQKFGVDWTGVDLYKKLGLKGHNGWDLSAVSGTEVFAVMDGMAYVETEAPIGNDVPVSKNGYGINIRLRNRSLGLEAVYGHLQNTLIKNGDTILAGEPIALSDNTGISTGPHLHLGLREIFWSVTGAGPYVKNDNNGYFGYVDPEPFFPVDIFDLPVDRGYGLKPVKSELAWYADAAYFWRKVGRLPSQREKLALLNGRWDLRTVLDDAFFPVWSEYDKPTAIKMNLIKQV